MESTHEYQINDMATMIASEKKIQLHITGNENAVTYKFPEGVTCDALDSIKEAVINNMKSKKPCKLQIDDHYEVIFHPSTAKIDVAFDGTIIELSHIQRVALWMYRINLAYLKTLNN